jgi:hypothetical protein
MKWEASSFDARIGAGFPGWHIECSAMSKAHLGDTIDIHTGGEDNVFPHHECEISQSCCADDITTPAPGSGTPRPTFARYWVHGRHLLVNGRKMSKRDGTFFTVRDLLAPVAAGRAELSAELERHGFTGGHVPAPVLRLTLISSHHGQPLNFTFDLLVQARTTVERLQSLHDRLREAAGDTPSGAVTADVRTIVDEHLARFDARSTTISTCRCAGRVLALVRALDRRSPARVALDLPASTRSSTCSIAVRSGSSTAADNRARRIVRPRARNPARGPGSISTGSSCIATPRDSGATSPPPIAFATSCAGAASSSRTSRTGCAGSRRERAQVSVCGSDLPQVAGLQHDAHVVDLAVDLVITRREADVRDLGALLERDRRALQLEALDQDDGISRRERVPFTSDHVVVGVALGAGARRGVIGHSCAQSAQT